MLPKLPPLRPATIAARIDAAPNLVTLFLDRADEQPAAPFLVAKVGGGVHELVGLGVRVVGLEEHVLEEVRESGVLRGLRERPVLHHQFDSRQRHPAARHDDHLEAVGQDATLDGALEFGPLRVGATRRETDRAGGNE